MPFVGTGTCDPVVLDNRIAEIEERLWPKADWRMSVRRLRVLVRNRAFVLPAGVTRVCAADVDGSPAALASEAYEFSSAGPGDLDLAGTGERNLVDMGEFATQYDVPVQRISDAAWSAGLPLIAFSPSADDATASITVRGYDSHGQEITSPRAGVTAPGESIAINRWALGRDGVIINLPQQPRSKNRFASVAQVNKPVTKGPVTLYAYNPATSELFLLSKMEPATTVPSYRRYRLTGVAGPEANTEGGLDKDCASALLLVKVGWQRAVWADDVLYIQSLAALKLMSLAINKENAGDFSSAVNLEVLATRALQEQRQDQDGQVSVPVIWDMDKEISLGSRLNRGHLM